jgi:hypothetical protein
MKTLKSSPSPPPKRSAMLFWRPKGEPDKRHDRVLPDEQERHRCEKDADCGDGRTPQHRLLGAIALHEPLADPDGGDDRDEVSQRE